MRTRFYVLLFLLLSLATAGSVWAQISRGGISGTVTDASGAAVAAAPVVALEVDTGVSHQTVSSSAGAFNFADLPLGNYTVTVDATGFEKIRVEHIVVNAGQIFDVPVKLGVQHQDATVVVSADAI